MKIYKSEEDKKRHEKKKGCGYSFQKEIQIYESGIDENITLKEIGNKLLDQAKGKNIAGVEFDQITFHYFFHLEKE